MVAMTNTTLEQQRKKLATQSASLLAQYNDLLMELSCGCERTIKDKLHELIIKKERLEKMFKDYDISFEKNMSRVSNNKCSTNQQSSDSIYGLLWEAETPPIQPCQSDSKFFNSSALLRQTRKSFHHHVFHRGIRYNDILLESIQKKLRPLLAV
ncbi:hypothetical protein BLA29_011544 [Euroglyphus maynei]|uniref:Uncharacterized protein n=1 Tax=Euroglyphus maynei TaxID=6958 RepID=A0A1Y3B3S8_EURMA|nr:hypothetical protein BLA29_011544 [Euroglyphus maynei]